MKFLQIVELETEVNKNELAAELSAARSIGAASMGSTHIFIKKGLKQFYIPYSKIYRAFRRVKAIPARICCANGEIQLQYVVLCSNKEELFEFDLPDEKAAVAIIEELQLKSPKTKIGVKK